MNLVQMSRSLSVFLVEREQAEFLGARAGEGPQHRCSERNRTPQVLDEPEDFLGGEGPPRHAQPQGLSRQKVAQGREQPGAKRAVARAFMSPAEYLEPVPAYPSPGLKAVGGVDWRLVCVRQG